MTNEELEKIRKKFKELQEKRTAILKYTLMTGVVSVKVGIWKYNQSVKPMFIHFITTQLQHVYI